MSYIFSLFPLLLPSYLISFAVQELGSPHKMNHVLPSNKTSPQVISNGLPHLSMAEYERFASISQNANIATRGRVSVYLQTYDYYMLLAINDVISTVHVQMCSKDVRPHKVDSFFI